jgi:hypothetical protein
MFHNILCIGAGSSARICFLGRISAAERWIPLRPTGYDIHVFGRGFPFPDTELQRDREGFGTPPNALAATYRFTYKRRSKARFRPGSHACGPTNARRVARSRKRKNPNRRTIGLIRQHHCCDHVRYCDCRPGARTNRNIYCMAHGARCWRSRVCGHSCTAEKSIGNTASRVGAR